MISLIVGAAAIGAFCRLPALMERGRQLFVAHNDLKDGAAVHHICVDLVGTEKTFQKLEQNPDFLQPFNLAQEMIQAGQLKSMKEEGST